MKSLRHSLSLRIAITLGVLMIVMLGLGYSWLVTQDRDLMRQEEDRKAVLTAQALVASLKSIMLAGAGNLAHDWIRRIDSLPQVQDAKVFRVDGTEAFVDQKTINRVNAFLKADRFHRKSAGRAPERIPAGMATQFAQVAGRELKDVKIRHGDRLTFLYPIKVEHACLHCHGYTANPLRGVLMLNVSTAQADSQLTHLQDHAALIFGTIACLLMGGTWFGLRRQVFTPLSSLAEASDRIRSGDLSHRADLERQDELGAVATNFNALVSHLVEEIGREGRLRRQQEALTEAVINLSRSSVSEQVLRRLGELAMEMTDARYAMLGYLDGEQNKHFIPLGIDEGAVAKMGPFPEGKGLLGLLWDQRQLVRVDHIAGHASGVGFPENHPAMTSFLGAPIEFGDMMLGALYLTDKQGGQPFGEDDELTVRVLTAACAVALANAHHMESLNEANEVLERRVEERTSELSTLNRQLRSHEVELELMNEELTRANEAKNQFLANTSHELRTPLNAIIGFSDLLGNPRIGPMNDKQVRYVDHIHTSGKRLLTIINDLLDISKIEAGMMHIEETRCVPGELARQVVAELKPLADAKGISLLLQEGEGVDGTVMADCGKLHQVLINLVGNAIKFTDEGEVRLEIGLASPAAGRFQVEASVQDTGIGIGIEDQERIFEPFVQAKGGLDRKHGGTGLGLALARRQINLLGGNLRLKHSLPGSGSWFTIELPVRVGAEESGQSPVQSEPAAIPAVAEVMEVVPDRAPEPCILVVDASKERAEAIIAIFSEEGYRGIYAEPAQMISAAEHHCPFLIMLGLSEQTDELHRQLQLIKSAPATRELPVILAGGSAEAPEFSMGTVGVVGGDIERNELLDAISRFGRFGAHRPSVHIPKVLVIDDDETVREFLKETLVTEGYGVILAKNGDDGVRLAIEREPDLIILDLMMPGITGYEVVSRLRQHPNATDIPVMIYTAKDLSREESLKLGSEVERVLLKGATGRSEILRQLHKLEMVYPVQAHLIDATLNCFNTRYLQRRLEQEISNASRYAQRFSLIGWEVDGYEDYVRRYGERWGLVALKEIVTMVKAVTRRGDVCAHVGISRFVLFLPNISMEGAGRVAEKIRLRVRHQRFPLPGEQVGRLTLSFGAVHYGDDGEDAATLLDELERRVTEARGAGGDQGRVGELLA